MARDADAPTTYDAADDDRPCLNEILSLMAAIAAVAFWLLFSRKSIPPPTDFLAWGGLMIQSVFFGYFSNSAFGVFFGFYWHKIKKLPFTPDADQMQDEIYALLFAKSSEAIRVERRKKCAVDHLVYTCAKLEEGVAEIERLTGVRAAKGGKHMGVGTHNALLSLGDDVYLEIIAPDPTQPPPEQPRPFSLDEPSTHDQIIAYAVHPVAKEGATIELLSATMRLAGYDPGPIASMSRLKPDGGELQWRLTPLAKAVGPRPWIIDWGQTTHPATTSPKGCKLVGLSCIGMEGFVSPANTHEELYPGPAMATVLDKMGLQPLANGKKVTFHVKDLRSRHLVAEIETPSKGKVFLGGEA